MRALDAKRKRLRRWVGIPAVWLTGTGMLIGCRGGDRAEPAFVANPSLGPLAIAVAPALNQSGSADFDPNRFADLMAGELSYADDIKVIPVSRVLAVLAAQGLENVQSPAHALELTELLGADAILVFSVTEYDPYDPPSLGITAQLYGARPGAGHGSMDPMALSRRAELATSTDGAASRGLLAQTQGVFDAAHDSVAADIKAFAKRRDADASPHGWRKYVVSQQHFIRYCCYATIQRLLGDENEATLAHGDPRGVRMP